MLNILFNSINEGTRKDVKTNQYKEASKEHLIYKLIRRADVNLLNGSKTGSSTVGVGKSIEAPPDRTYLHAYNQELLGSLSVFCKLTSLCTKL